MGKEDTSQSLFDGIDFEGLSDMKVTIDTESTEIVQPLNPVKGEKGTEETTTSTEELIEINFDEEGNLVGAKGSGEKDKEATDESGETNLGDPSKKSSSQSTTSSVSTSSSEEEKNKGLKPEDSGAKSSTSPVLSTLAKALKEQGAFPSIDEKELEGIDSAEKLVTAMAKQLEANELKGLNEDQKNYLTMLRSGVPEERAKQLTEANNKLHEIPEEALVESPQLRYNVILQDLILKGVDKDRASKIAATFVETKADVEEAKLSLRSLQEFSKKKIADEIKAKQEEARLAKESEAKKLEELKSFIEGTDEPIKGVKINSTTKEKMFKLLTEVVKVDEQTQTPLNAISLARKENPHAVDTALAWVFLQTDGFKNIGKLKSITKTDVLKELDQALHTADEEELRGAISKGNNRGLTKNQEGLLGALDAF